MGIKKVIGDRNEIVPLRKLVFFDTEDTIGKVLDELSRRKSSLCLVKHAAGISVTTVPQLLRIAGTRTAESQSDQIRGVVLREILTKLDKLPSAAIQTEAPRPPQPIFGRPVPGGIDRVESSRGPTWGDSRMPTSDAARTGLALPAEYAAAVMVAASYWECLEETGTRCVKADKPPRNCSDHDKAWKRH